MFSIVIAVGPASDKISLLFKTEEAADRAMKVIGDPKPSSISKIQDDFGQIVVVRDSEIHAVIFEDMDLSAEGNIERGLHQARTQARGNSRAQSDSALRTAAMMGQGPMIVGPGMGHG